MATIRMSHRSYDLLFQLDARFFVQSGSRLVQHDKTALPPKRRANRACVHRRRRVRLPAIAASMDALRSAYHSERPAAARVFTSASSCCAVPENMVNCRGWRRVKTKVFWANSVTRRRNPAHTGRGMAAAVDGVFACAAHGGQHLQSVDSRPASAEQRDAVALWSVRSTCFKISRSPTAGNILERDGSPRG